MIIFWQILTFLGIVSLALFWGTWVYETQKERPIPEKLGAVLVHGIDDGKSEQLGKAIALGASSMIAEHFRAVDRINEAARTAGQDLIITSGLPPEPLLLASTNKHEPISVSVEFGGAKLDSSGLARILPRNRNDIAALELSVSLIPTEEEGKWNATTSASYRENSAYGFLSRASGTIDEIAAAIAMRFIQAHYAVDDPFHNALPAEDFAKLWHVRSEAGHMALRAVSGGVETAEELKAEAVAAYDSISHLFKRYKEREDIQKLALYLSQVADRPPEALQHARHVRSRIKNEDQRTAFDKLIDQLQMTVTERAAAAKAAKVEDDLPAVSKESLEELLQNLREGNSAALEMMQLSELEEKFPTVRPPRIGVVSANPHSIWLHRVHTVIGFSTETVDSVLKDYSSQILSLLVSSAPDAEITLSVIHESGFSGGAASQEDLIGAIDALTQRDLDVILFPFGVSIRHLQGADRVETWRNSVEPFINAGANSKGVLIIPGGNDQTELPELAAQDGANYLVVGGLGVDGGLAGSSNYGPGVDIYAPFENISHSTRGSAFTQVSGSSAAATLAAVAVARIAASRDQPINPSELSAAVRNNAVASDNSLVTDWLAVARQLNANE